MTDKEFNELKRLVNAERVRAINLRAKQKQRSNPEYRQQEYLNNLERRKRKKDGNI